MVQDLARNGLDESVLRQALQRELLFDAVMSRVSADCPPVDDLDVELFYQTHRERFSVHEKRVARHILVTINADYAENRRDVVWAKLENVQQQLLDEGIGFAEAAQRYSECPSAVDGGKLGSIGAGQLYPELDRSLFLLPPGGISSILESELGLHLLLCEAITPARLVPFSEVSERIKQTMQQRRLQSHQGLWLRQIKQ
jgi:peptidyl-prolyl cis-trans isomerase C